MNSNNQDTASLPLAVRYGIALSPAVMGQQTMSRFDAVNGSTFGMGASSQEIRINVSAPGFLLGSHSYLHFELANVGSKGVKLQNSAADIIESIRLESNGVELERLDGYNMYDGIIRNYKGIESTNTVGSIEGQPDTSLDASNQVVAGVLSHIAATTGNNSYVIRLNSGFLSGGALKKAIPLIGTGGFTIVLRLATVSEAFIQVNADGTQSDGAVGAANVSVKNPRFYAPVFQIEDAGFAQRYSTMLNSMGIEWSGVTSKRYTNQLAIGGANNTNILQLNDRSLSLRGFATVIRPNANADAFKNNSLSGDVTICTRYRYMISGQENPLGGIDVATNNPGRAYLEALNLFTDMTEPQTVVDDTLFLATAVSAAGAAGDTSNLYSKGSICVNLKKYGDRNLNLTGLNTAMSTTPSTVELTTTAIAAVMRVDTFAICDAIYRLDANGAFSSVY